MSLCTVTDVEYMHCVILDGEKDAIDVVSTAIEELPYFFLKVGILWGQRTAPGKLL